MKAQGARAGLARLARRWWLVGLHLAVIAGLMASIAAAIFFDGYFNRGVAVGPNLTPIPYTDVNPMGINTLLNEETDPAKVQRSLDMIAAAGFTFVRQMFPWSDIEPAKGVYTDPRTGASTWTKYDRIVNLAASLNLQIIARLDSPPAWARAGQPNLDKFPVGPPNNDADFAGFVSAFVTRYRGKVHYIQIWNEPNLQGEWGGQPIDPARFTQLLKAAYVAAKQADPGIVVLMPGLAPTDQTGPTNLSDLLFLEAMYKDGAKPYFDIAVAMVYGYGYSPYDRRVEFKRDNFSRVIQTREIMVWNGDSDKPVWAAEYGWVSLPAGWKGNPSVWGKPVSRETQAQDLYEGYLRAQQEWPWMGVMAVWYFREPIPPTAPDQDRNPTPGFSIVGYDFTPTPAYTLLSRARDILDRAYTGAYPATSRLIQQDGGWQLRSQGGSAELAPDRSGARLTIRFAGPRLDLLVAGTGAGFGVSIDGGTARELAASSGESRVTVADGLSDGPHVATIEALAGAAGSRVVTGFVVVRMPLMSWIYPWIYAALSLATVLNLASLAWCIRSGRRPRRETRLPALPRPVLRASQVRARRVTGARAANAADRRKV